MTSTNDFPTAGVELRHLLVVSDYARSLAFYRDVLGATVVREGPLREAIMARTNERELANDPERRGAGVMMRVDRVRSRGQVIQLREGSGAASG